MPDAPDAPLFAGVIAVGLAVLRSGARDRVLGALRVLALPMALTLAQLAFRLAYYGDFVPNTAHVKIHPSADRWADGARYLSYGTVALLPFSLLAAGATCAALTRRATHREAVLLTLLALAWGVYLAFVGGDVFPAYRQLVPLCAVMALALPLGVEALARRARALPLTLALAATCVAFVAWQSADSEVRRARDETWEWDGELIGRMLAQGFHREQPLIAVDAAGAVPFWSRLPALDMLGLNDRHIARGAVRDGPRLVGHELGDGRYVLDQKPDLVLFGPPTGSLRAMFRSGIEMQTLPEFAARYTCARFVVRAPRVVESLIWVDRASPRIGVRDREGTIAVPCWLFGRDGEVAVELGADGELGVAVGEQGVTCHGLSLPRGTWRVAAPAGAVVRIRAAGAAPEEGAAPPTLTLDGGRYDVEVRAAPGGSVLLREVRLERG